MSDHEIIPVKPSPALPPKCSACGKPVFRAPDGKFMHRKAIVGGFPRVPR